LIASMANSVNITDGLDGLAWWLLVQNYFLYTFITFHEWLFLLSALCVIIAASLTAFLWFNIKPAKFYLWDSWALALGWWLAIIALMTDTLPILFIISWVYFWEISSVIIQVASKKLRHGKKVFLIAPYHHHLEAKGVLEETIVMKAWLIWAILSALAIIAYLVPPLF
jgi:phospho-N-acetylmuramoyl-pentapeptide-transferase